jgi:hypothetical protein
LSNRCATSLALAWAHGVFDVAVFTRLIGIMPGAAWAKTSEMKKKFGIG